MSFRSKNAVLMFIILMFLISFMAHAADGNIRNDTVVVDSTRKTFPGKKAARRKWEYIVSAPLWIATSPLYLTYKLLGGTVEIMDNHHIPGKLERILVSEDGTRHIEPYYSSTTGLGINIWKEGLIAPCSRFNIAGSYGLQNRHGFEIEWRSIPTLRNKLFLDAHFAYHYVPDEPFYGIGTVNKTSDETSFFYKDVISFLSLRYQAVPLLNVYMAGTLDYYSTGKGDKKEVASVEQYYSSNTLLVGLNSRSIMGGGIIGIDLDTRDNSGRTRKGTLLKVHAAACNEIKTDTFQDEDREVVFGYRQSVFDVFQFIPMPWADGRVLVLRAAVQMLDQMEDKEIPVYRLSTLGGDETIRGYSRGRFRDNDYALFSAEYRYPVWWDHPFCLDAAVFFDAGQVSSNIMQMPERDNFHYGYGGGFRVYNHDELTASLYFGFSKDDYRAEFALGEDSLTRLLNVIKKLTNI